MKAGQSEQMDGSGEDPDAALLRRYAAGDRVAAQDLVVRLGSLAYRVALRYLNNPAEAEDVAQEAMMRLWRVAPDWQTGGARVTTWLYRVTLNLCIDHRRRAKGGTVALDEIGEPADETAPVEAQIQARARADALQEALQQLPDRQRQAVVLRHLEDLSNPEIAVIMGISIEAVESLTARGKKTLVQVFAGREAELGYQDG